MTFYVGKLVTFKDRAGNPVRYFERIRRNYSPATFKSEGAATRAVNKANQGLPFGGSHFSMSTDVWNANQEMYNPQCYTYNMLNRESGFCMIDADGFGGCCDPATERYHCM